MAQQLEEVLPEAVREVTRPADLDEDGNVLVPAATFKAVNYEALVPLLIASNNEQQQRIARLEEMVAACCLSTGADTRGATDPIDPTKVGSADTRLRIQPNPVIDRTTVFYTLEHAGRVQLLANSADGKELRVLQEATQEKGAYQLEWNTADLSFGVYYVTLLLDGSPIVKKAVKVAR